MPGASPTFKGVNGGDKLVDKLNFLSLMVGRLWRDSFSAAHSHPLLHGKRRRGGPGEHGGGDRRTWFSRFVCLYLGLGRHDQRSARPDG